MHTDLMDLLHGVKPTTLALMIADCVDSQTPPRVIYQMIDFLGTLVGSDDIWDALESAGVPELYWPEQ